MAQPLVNSYTNWGKLKEVWLGDVYPSHFYDHLESQVRDVFYELTDRTKQDLSIIERKLTELGVDVVRPVYKHLDDFILSDYHPTMPGQLARPQICPRDHFLVYGNKLIGDRFYHLAWQHAIDKYRKDSSCTVIDDLRLEHLGYMSGANSVRVGQDLYLDVFYTDHGNRDQMIQELEQKIQPMFPNTRLHLLSNGGHVDACFAVIKPGLLLTSGYFADYDRTFPNWSRINIAYPEFAKHQRSRFPAPDSNGKWWNTGGSTNQAFNEHVIKHALDWVGNYTETFFEVNCLVIDEHNVLMLGENESVFRTLEQHGVTAHSLPFRTRTFWDGGLHCITLDSRREDSPVDLFPDRQDNIYYY